MAGRGLNTREAAFVAAYIGEANGNATEAARLAGYRGTEGSLRVRAHRLLTRANVQAAIAAHTAEVRARGIAVKQNRLDSYRGDFELLERVRLARAEHYRDKAPGGDTGLIVGQLKLVKHLDDTGDDGQRVWMEEQWEYVLDTGLLAERRHLRKQIAQELGEWTERRDVTGKIGVDLHAADSAFQALADRIARIAERAGAGAVSPGSEPAGA